MGAPLQTANWKKGNGMGRTNGKSTPKKDHRFVLGGGGPKTTQV